MARNQLVNRVAMVREKSSKNIVFFKVKEKSLNCISGQGSSKLNVVEVGEG